MTNQLSATNTQPAVKDQMTNQLKDHIADGRRALKRGHDASRVFHHCMTAVERDDFDAMLVRTGDPLALRAGTTESRFYSFIGR